MTEAFKITEKENSGLKRTYDVVIAASVIEEKVNEELQRIGRQVKIPGFRPGKVPMQILKQRYKQNTLGDAINTSVDEALRAIFKKYDVVPALQPDAKIEKYEEDQDVELSVSFEIMPESPELELGKLSINKPVIDISDEEVQKSLDRLAQGKRQMKDRSKTAKAKEGDVVVIDFKGFLGDEAFEGGEGKEYSLELGSGQFIPGFEEQLIGVKAGESKDVNVTFPEAYHSANLAGKEARFEVNVHKVQEITVPEMTDELAKEFGFESLEELKNFLRSSLEKEYEGVTRNYLKKQLFDELEKLCEFDVPEKMLKMEFEAIWRQAKAEAKQNGESEESLEEDREEFEAIAKRRVRLGIYLSQTAGRNKIEVTQQDVQNAIIQQARMYPGQEAKVIEFFQKNPQQVQELRGPILEEKAVDYVLEQVKLVEVKKTIEELLKEEEAEAEAKQNSKKDTSSKKSASKPATEKKKAASDEKKSDTKASSGEEKKKAPAKKATAKKEKDSA